MPVENWIAYALAYTILSVIPGPSVLMVISQALSRGKRAAMACIMGDVAGGAVIMTASYLGLGLILASSSMAFMVLKWLGVAYMAYLGFTQIREARSLAEIKLHAQPKGGFRVGFVTGVLNPKAIMFYMAFLAQFMDPAAAQVPQLLILMATSSVVVMVVLGIYALLASKISEQLKTVRARKGLAYAGGSFLLGGSALMAATR
ncbi:LysE family translocator [Paracoccus fistulariae]|uniref:LysE family translocator n=1 Tax=Paracoccus fistulariae TaxID=658446 RepID=A0ABY7SHZ3_9RHOB|nr:LysE family translocator [Paracoccus fistulariae]MDB6181239.1 LysE family translocator [Paracoccus fistulariae]WCR06519.1 LysE family translocator [Paracoccus fistulariae]